MHRYLMAVRHYFRGYEQFTISANSKTEALEKGKLHVLRDPHYDTGGNYDVNDIKCIKKIQTKERKKNER